MVTISPPLKSDRPSAAARPGAENRRSASPGGTFFSTKFPAASTDALIAVPATETRRPGGAVDAAEFNTAFTPAVAPLDEPPAEMMLPLTVAVEALDGSAGLLELHAVTAAASATHTNSF